ncbi:hypothetical protein AB0383_09725 [Amycolatopsis sp. NPDC051373]|uniref:hypothetical protein n=1 Tax=Amycolatopsis sp. NPDC051373 TaxID=3155801 RepID=UPI00344E827A
MLEDAVAFRDDMRRRAAGYGRHSDSIKILPGMSVVLGATEQDAQERKQLMDAVFGVTANIKKLSKRVGLPVEVLKLDEKFPAHLLGPDEEFTGSIGFRRSIVSLAVKEDLTVRELIGSYGGGHHQVVGTAEQVADRMQERLLAGAADGFTLMVDMLPSGVHDAVEMLVPQLQRRGLFHTDYEHDTLRESLGLPAPSLVPAG